MRQHLVPLALAAALAGGLVPVATPAAHAATKPVVYKNCKALNAKYAHGVKMTAKALDKKRNGARIASKAVTNAQLYAVNKKLDADKDGIACEK